MTFFPYPPKRDSLLYVARHGAVTLTCNAPSKALRPGISVSRVEPSGDLFSWYSPSSSRSLGHSLLLGQRSRLNFFSHRKVFVSSTPPRPARTVYGPPPRWPPEDRDDADVFSPRCERTSATRHPGGSPTKKLE